MHTGAILGLKTPLAYPVGEKKHENGLNGLMIICQYALIPPWDPDPRPFQGILRKIYSSTSTPNSKTAVLNVEVSDEH